MGGWVDGGGGGASTVALPGTKVLPVFEHKMVCAFVYFPEKDFHLDITTKKDCSLQA